MSTEMFTPVTGGDLPFTGLSDKTATVEQYNYQASKTMSVYRCVGWVLFVLLIILLVYVIYATYWIMRIMSRYSKKEGLQYLGASTNVVRDDHGWSVPDSLAEKAYKFQSQVTPETYPAAPVAPVASGSHVTFVSQRDGMVSKPNEKTPEEKLLSQQRRY